MNNITLDTPFSTAGLADIDNATSTVYKPPVRTQKAQGSGYSLDIADKVTDNEAYKGHGWTAEEIMQQAGNLDPQTQKDFMIVMSACVSEEDLRRMQEEGFRPGSMDVDTYVSIVDRIKVTLAKAGVEIAGYNDDIDVDTVEEITGSRVDANALVKELSEIFQRGDIPATKENISQIVNAVAEASEIGELSEDTLKYMITNGKTPTIENIYKAQFSSAADMKQAQGYYSEGAGNYGKYFSKKAEEINWDNIRSRLEAVVRQAGLDGDEETKAAAMENAKWLVESGIELTGRNLTLLSDLRSLELPPEQEKLLNWCVTAIANGKAPVQALMTGETSIAEQAQELMDTVESISDEAVHATVEAGTELNIKSLSAAQSEIEAQGDDAAKAPEASQASLKEIEARRQLEEIRLMMSEEANRHLLKNGISIDTTELSKLVDALRLAEEQLRAALFHGDSVEENDRMAALYDETLTTTKELGGMPAALVGKMIASGQAYTLIKLHREGEALQDQYQENRPNQGQSKQAMDAYETLMTAPRKDLGDSIGKAFRNIDDILTDMGIETSEENRRAIRILGYNSMVIDEENINAVKEADSQVCGIIRRMTPATTLQMIREQKNPLEMSMEELDAYLNEQDRDFGADAERFSKFLQKLDRSNGITQDEREAYIGIYRMFRQIEKSDGAVIGSIVAAGAEMNFKNILSAIRTRADKNMDIRVDDGFGALEELISKGTAIDEQIMSGFQERQKDFSENADSRQQYYARLSGEINEELAERTDPEKLRDISITAETTPEGFAGEIRAAELSEEDIRRQEQSEESLKAFQDSLREAQRAEDAVIESLMDYGQTVSVDNILAASLLTEERGALYRQIFAGRLDSASGKADEEDEAASEKEALMEAADNVIESLTDAESAGRSYRELVEAANRAVEQMTYRQGVSPIDVKAAQALYKGLALAGNLAWEENYEIPMNIKGEVTSVNLKIYHNAAKAGKVAVTLDTETLGKVAAEFEVRRDSISGMVVYENRQEKYELEQVDRAMREELSRDGDRQIIVSMVQSKDVDLRRFGQDRDGSAGNGEALSTTELYQTAKAFIKALKGL
ncbi:MAG: DUF6240 domain-containing protein [Roseburia sp.]|nr:DUF6240 domain-containing protein [Roseburia sp.]